MPKSPDTFKDTVPEAEQKLLSDFLSLSTRTDADSRETEQRLRTSLALALRSLERQT